VLEFRAAVESRDLARMEAALSPDVVFRSPAVFKPYEGREAVMHLLSTVVQVFEDFEYTDELEGDRTHALVFKARVGDREVEGLDHLTVDADGLITQLVVMVRPLSGLTALAQAMAERLGVAS
jgi:SnoaL-like domain